MRAPSLSGPVRSAGATALHTGGRRVPLRRPSGGSLAFPLLCILLAHLAPAAAADGGGSDGWPMPPDTRPGVCHGRSYGPAGDNVSVSVIIPYLKETWEHLGGTLRSLVHFTPDELVLEYLFMSDGNPPDKVYEEELKAISPKVVVVKHATRLGLIQTKMRAAIAARGTVLAFMDAHCIVNRDWLQPMLEHLSYNPYALVQPILDVIPQTDFSQYHKNSVGRWRFEWNLNLIHVWQPEPKELGMTEDEPFPIPATSGGIFVINHDWWNRLKLYDPEILEWGGDHIEASMKLWRCGGHIVVHPCSRVGHLFRDPAHRPYPVEVKQVVMNYKRLAQVWLDDYIDVFYKMKPDARPYNVGDVSLQKQQREELQCKDMKWYLENVDPEMEWEVKKCCLPGCPVRGQGPCCEGDAATGRATLDFPMPRAVLGRKLKVIASRFRQKNEL